MKRQPPRVPLPPHDDAMDEIEELADSIIQIGGQIQATIAELRRRDTRGHSDDD